MRLIEILERTSSVLQQIMQELSDAWTSHNKGRETWNVPQIVQHLINVEKPNGLYVWS